MELVYLEILVELACLEILEELDCLEIVEELACLEIVEELEVCLEIKDKVIQFLISLKMHKNNQRTMTNKINHNKKALKLILQRQHHININK